MVKKWVGAGGKTVARKEQYEEVTLGKTFCILPLHSINVNILVIILQLRKILLE